MFWRTVGAERAPGWCLSTLRGTLVFGLKTASCKVKNQGSERSCGMAVHFSPLDGCLVSQPPQETVAIHVHREHPDPKRTQWTNGLLALSSCTLSRSLMPTIVCLTREQVSVTDKGLVCPVAGEWKHPNGLMHRAELWHSILRTPSCL